MRGEKFPLEEETERGAPFKVFTFGLTLSDMVWGEGAEGMRVKVTCTLFNIRLWFWFEIADVDIGNDMNLMLVSAF